MYTVFVEPRYPNKRLIPSKFPSECRGCARRAAKLFCTNGYNAWVEKDGKLVA